MCRLLKVQPAAFEIVSITAGSVRLNVVLHGQQNQDAALVNIPARLSELGDLSVRHMRIGDFGLVLDDKDLNPTFHKEYGSGKGMVKWVGPLKDAFNRGNKPYYCPIGKRCESF